MPTCAQNCENNFVQKNIVILLIRCSIIVDSGYGKINVFRTSPKTRLITLTSVLPLIGYFVILTLKIGMLGPNQT